MASPKKKAANKKPTPPLNKSTPATAALVEAIKAKKAEMKDVLKQMDNVAAEPSKLDPEMVAKAVEHAQNQTVMPATPVGYGAGGGSKGMVTFHGGGSVGGGGGASYSNGGWTFTVGSNSGSGWKPLGAIGASEPPKITPAPSAPPHTELQADIANWMHHQWPQHSVTGLLMSLVTDFSWSTYAQAVITLQNRIENAEKYAHSTAGSRYQYVLDKLQASKHNSAEAPTLSLKHDIAVWLQYQWPEFGLDELVHHLGDEYTTYDGAVAALQKCASFAVNNESHKYLWVLGQLQTSHHSTNDQVVAAPEPMAITPVKMDIALWMQTQWPDHTVSDLLQDALKKGFDTYDEAVAELEKRYHAAAKFKSGSHSAQKYEYVLNKLLASHHAPGGGIPFSSAQAVQVDPGQIPLAVPPQPSAVEVEFVPYDGTAQGARATALSIIGGGSEYKTVKVLLPVAFLSGKMTTYHQHVFLDACRTVIGEGMKHPAQHIHQMKRAQQLLDAAKV